MTLPRGSGRGHAVTNTAVLAAAAVKSISRRVNRGAIASPLIKVKGRKERHPAPPVRYPVSRAPDFEGNIMGVGFNVLLIFQSTLPRLLCPYHRLYCPACLFASTPSYRTAPAAALTQY